MGQSFYAPPKRDTYWLPSGFVTETFPRYASRHDNLNPLSSGRLSLAAGAVIPAGRTVSNITFFSATTAGGTLSNQWFCLVDTSLNVLAKTADDTSTAWAANSPKTLALSTPYTAATNLPVFIGIVVVASQVPTLASYNLNAGTSALLHSSLAPMPGSSTTGLTNPASLGSTAGAITLAGINPYAYLS